MGWHEIAGLAPLMFLIVAIGVYPRPVLEQMRPTLARIDQITQVQRDEADEAAPPSATCRGRGVEHRVQGQARAKQRKGGAVKAGSRRAPRRTAATKPTSKPPSGSPGPATRTQEKQP